MSPQANWISSSGQITMNIHSHSNQHLNPNTRVELVIWESNPSVNRAQRLNPQLRRKERRISCMFSGSQLGPQ